MRRGRSGLGIGLMIAIALVVLLGIGAIAQFRLSSDSLSMATRDAGGAVAEELAFSAIEEASSSLQKAFCDVENPLFWALRREILWARKGYLDLSSFLEPVKLREHLKSSRARSFYEHFRIEHLKVVLHVPRTRNGGDQFVDFDCAVSLRVARSEVYRRVCARRRYGVLLPTTYKPFDQITFAILDHSYLARMVADIGMIQRDLLDFNTGGESAAEVLRTARALGEGQTAPVAFPPPFLRSRKPPAMPAHVRRALEAIVEEKAKLDPSFRGLLAEMGETDRAWLEWFLVKKHPAGQVRLMVPSLPPDAPDLAWDLLPRDFLVQDAPAEDSVVFSTDPEVNLAEYDYELILSRTFARVRPELEHRMEAYNAEWVSLMKETPPELTSEGLRALLANLASKAQAIRGDLTQLAESLNSVTEHAKAHTRTGFSSTAIDGYLASSSHRLTPIAYHLRRAADLPELVRAYPTFNGHIVHGGDGPLTVKLEHFSGKAVLSVPYSTKPGTQRPLVVEQLSRAKREEDLIVLDGEWIDLKGPVIEGSIHVHDRVFFRNAPQIEGNLIISSLRFLTDRGRDEELRGTVRYDPRIWAGKVWNPKRAKDPPQDLELAHYVLTLCPRDLQVATFRSRDAGGD